MKANGPSPLDNMRNLEHYLNEISTGDSTEQQLKGKRALFSLQVIGSKVEPG